MWGGWWLDCPWGSGRKDTLGTLNSARSAHGILSPFDVFTQARHLLKLHKHGKSGVWERDSSAPPEAAPSLKGSFTLQPSSVPALQKGGGSLPECLSSLCPPLLPRGLGGQLLRVKDRVTFPDWGEQADG